MAFFATRDLNALTGPEDSLNIDGDAGDVVEAGEGWTDNGDAKLYVSNDVAVSAL